MGLFRDMSFLQTAAASEDNALPKVASGDLLKVYASYLAGIIGEYSQKRVLFLNMADDKNRKQLEELLNDPDSEIISQEGQFTSDESRSADEYYKTSGYHIFVIYKKHDYELACSNMETYLTGIEKSSKKPKSTGLLEAIATAWAAFSHGIQAAVTKSRASRIQTRLETLIENLRKNLTVEGEGGLAGEEDSRYTLSDEIAEPELPEAETPAEDKGKDSAAGEETKPVDNNVVIPDFGQLLLGDEGDFPGVSGGEGEDDDDTDFPSALTQAAAQEVSKILKKKGM